MPEYPSVVLSQESTLLWEGQPHNLRIQRILTLSHSQPEHALEVGDWLKGPGPIVSGHGKSVWIGLDPGGRICVHFTPLFLVLWFWVRPRQKSMFNFPPWTGRCPAQSPSDLFDQISAPPPNSVAPLKEDCPQAAGAPVPAQGAPKVPLSRS